MGLILLEALLALLVLVAIVWWTMFAGRSKGELRQDVAPPPTPEEPPSATPQAPRTGDVPPPAPPAA